MAQPQISIIIPAYNAEKTIQKTVKSVLGQTGHGLSYEILIVENGSDDRTWEICQTIADRHNAEIAEVALNWSRQKPFIDTCIVGAQKRSRVEGNLKCLNWELTEEEMGILDAAIREKIGR